MTASAVEHASYTDCVESNVIGNSEDLLGRKIMTHISSKSLSYYLLLLRSNGRLIVGRMVLGLWRSRCTRSRKVTQDRPWTETDHL